MGFIHLIKMLVLPKNVILVNFSEGNELKKFTMEYEYSNTITKIIL